MRNQNFANSTCLLFVLLLLLVGSGQVAGQQQPRVVDALEGLDPVMLVQGKEVQGELNITVTRGGFRYLFANAVNKTVFEQDPARYEIQLGGACARMGPPVTGIADLYAVHEGRVYIFGSEQCKKLFVAAPDKYLEPKATANLNATPEAAKQAKAWLEKAVTALGGAAKVDGLTSYHEQSVTTQTRGQGAENEVRVKQDLLIVFPHQIRFEQAMPDFRDASKTMRQSFVLLPSDSFMIGPRGVLPLPDALRKEQTGFVQSKPFALLRARQQASFKAAYLGAAKAGEIGVEQVAVEFEGATYTLGLEPGTGRVLTLTSKRRGPQGSFGDFVQTFGDYRTVEGVSLPFKIEATFEGQPWKEKSVIIEAITLNSPVDPALFAKPKAAQ